MLLQETGFIDARKDDMFLTGVAAPAILCVTRLQMHGVRQPDQQRRWFLPWNIILTKITKWDIPVPLFIYFRLFKQTIQLPFPASFSFIFVISCKQYNCQYNYHVKLVHPVCGAGI